MGDAVRDGAGKEAALAVLSWLVAGKVFSVYEGSELLVGIQESWWEGHSPRQGIKRSYGKFLCEAMILRMQKREISRQYSAKGISPKGSQNAHNGRKVYVLRKRGMRERSREGRSIGKKRF